MTQCEHMSTVAQQLEQEGMAHVRGLLTETELAPIRTVLIKLHSNFNQLPKNINKNSDNNSGSEIREISRLIKHSPLFQHSPVFAKCFELARQIFGKSPHYGHDEAIFKATGGQPVGWHQDQTYSKYDKDKQCVSIWIPLQDTNKFNGGMEYVVDRQDSLLKHSRVTSDSFMYQIPSDHLNNKVTVSPEMAVGDVCVHTPLCIHRSHPNNSDQTRIAWIIQFNKYGKSRFLRLSNLKRYITGIN